MGKHAGTVAGWALDLGADRKRRANGRPKFGKHAAPQHAGNIESRLMGRFMAVVRRVSFLPKHGRHGVAHARTSKHVRVPLIGWVRFA